MPRRTGASTPGELLRFGASALRGVAIIEAEYAICRGLDAMDHDVERAADELLALCRIAPDSLFRLCGPDGALRDAVALHPAPWRRCAASWEAFSVACTPDFSASSASPIGLTSNNIA